MLGTILKIDQVLVPGHPISGTGYGQTSEYDPYNNYEY
jgi:hypothetical protein